MIPRECKRLAEVGFSGFRWSRHAARGKSIQHGHPITMLPSAGGPAGGTSAKLRCGPLKFIVQEPASFSWREVTKVQHYWLDVNALQQPMTVQEHGELYRRSDKP